MVRIYRIMKTFKIVIYQSEFAKLYNLQVSSGSHWLPAAADSCAWQLSRVHSVLSHISGEIKFHHLKDRKRQCPAFEFYFVSLEALTHRNMQDPSDHQTTTPMKQTSHAPHLGFDFLESVKILWMETLYLQTRDSRSKLLMLILLCQKGQYNTYNI